MTGIAYSAGALQTSVLLALNEEVLASDTTG
jgi:hypothetical protein